VLQVAEGRRGVAADGRGLILAQGLQERRLALLGDALVRLRAEEPGGGGADAGLGVGGLEELEGGLVDPRRVPRGEGLEDVGLEVGVGLGLEALEQARGGIALFREGPREEGQRQRFAGGVVGLHRGQEALDDLRIAALRVDCLRKLRVPVAPAVDAAFLHAGDGLLDQIAEGPARLGGLGRRGRRRRRCGGLRGVLRRLRLATAAGGDGEDEGEGARTSGETARERRESVHGYSWGLSGGNARPYPRRPRTRNPLRASGATRLA
jgi:hypothetical protein